MKLLVFILSLLSCHFLTAFEVTFDSVSEDQALVLQEQVISFYSKELLKADLFQDETAALSAAKQEIISEKTINPSHYYSLSSDELKQKHFGYISYSIHEHTAYLESLYLEKSYRGMGLGQKVLTSLELELEKRGCNHIKLYVFAHNNAALNLYKKMGYTIESTYFKNESPIGFHMKKSLNGADIVKNHEIVQKPAIQVIGIVCRTSNAPEAGPQDIPKLWERFYREDVPNRIPNKLSNDIIALYCDYEGDHTAPYSIIIGCPVSSISSIPEGMVAKTIPSSSYAVFRAVGDHPKALIETWERIWKQSDLQRTYTGDFELYGDKFLSEAPKEVEVFIASEDIR